MKKSVCILLFLALLILLPSCSVFDPEPIRSLPSYVSKEVYESGEFQDYTDYGKYIYHSLSDDTFRTSDCFKQVSDNNIGVILEHVKHFSGQAIYCGNSDDIKALRSHYDFKESYVQEGDWYYLESRHENIDGHMIYYNYTLYYVDLDTQTLYYFHHNI